MKTNRIEAFSDGVMAILITIMVLELKTSHDPTPASLAKMWPTLFAYVLSFTIIAIYWVIRTLAAATATGRSGNTPVLPASNESRKATSISAANTLQSMLRVIWKARWKRASDLRMRSSRLCAESFNRRA
jgi:hypothetical protein